MKNFKKGFTLVEMLIVVVIIGILSAALLPRLQGAQSSARDSARKSDLSQLGSAILSYYNNRGWYPWSWSSDDTWMVAAVDIRDVLMSVVELSSLPADPNRNNEFCFSLNWVKDEWNTKSSCEDGGWDWVWSWQYWYMRMTKNTIRNWWYIIMARTETEWWSNYLSTITSSWDLKNWNLCTRFLEATDSECAAHGNSATTEVGADWLCCYENKWQLRYVYVF